jgi:hypothetical protein
MPADPLAPLVAAVFDPATAPPHPCRLRPLVRLRRLMPPSHCRYLPGTRGPGFGGVRVRREWRL